MRPGDIGDGAGRLPRPREAAEAPIDLDAVRADDDLIEALAAGLVPPPGGRPPADDVDEQLVALLAGWVADVRPETLLHRPGDPPPGPRPVVGAPPPAEVAATAPVRVGPGSGEHDPLPETPAVVASERVAARPGTALADTGPVPVESSTDRDGDHAEDDQALEAQPQKQVSAPIPITGGRHRRRPAGPVRFGRVAAAAVFLVLAGSGIVAGSWGAKPGTVLWPVTRIVFAEKARSVQAATVVHDNLERARDALRDGRSAEAQAALAVVMAQLPEVADADGHDVLAALTSEVNQQLVTTDPNAGDPRSSSDPGQTVLASGSAGAVITPAPGLPDRGGRQPRSTPPVAAALPGVTGTTGVATPPVDTGAAATTGTAGTGSTGTGAGVPGLVPGDLLPGDGPPTGGSAGGGGDVSGTGPPVVTVVATTPPPPPPPPTTDPPVITEPPVTTEPSPGSPAPSFTPHDGGTPADGGDATSTGTPPSDGSGSTSGSDGSGSAGDGTSTGAGSGSSGDGAAATGGDGAGSSAGGGSGDSGSSGSGSSGSGSSGSGSSGSGSSGSGSSGSGTTGGGSTTDGSSGSGSSGDGRSEGTSGGAEPAALTATDGTIRTIAGVLVTGSA